MRLLLTGAPGWFGSRFVDLWATARDRHGLDGCALRCLVQPGASTRELAANGLEVVTADLRDRASVDEAVRGVELVIHAAAVVHARRTADFERVNVGGTSRLLESARRAGVRRFVYLSSDAAVGLDDPEPAPETAPCRPASPYGRSKLRAEEIVRAGDDPAGMRTVVLRPGLFYGVRQPDRIVRVLRMVRAGRAIVIGDGETRQSLTFVDDLVEAALLGATHAAAPGNVFWIADDQPYSTRAILEAMAAALGVRLSVWKVPAAAARAARAAESLLGLVGLHNEYLHAVADALRQSVFDTGRARRLLGFAPSNDLEGGLRAAIAWARARGDFRL